MPIALTPLTVMGICMAQIDLSRKYSNFIAPKNQISINNEDLQQKRGITAPSLIVEQAAEAAPKFAFTIDDPQAKWINTSLFEPCKTVEVKMGYGTVLEQVMAGEVTAVKSIFQSSRGPQIEISGEGKNINSKTQFSGSPLFSLTYGNTLLSFTAIASAGKQAAKTATTPKLPIAKTPQNILSCTAECIGIPDIKVNAVITLTGLGAKFNQNYLVEKAVHSWDNFFGFRTKFEAKTHCRSRNFV